MVQLGHQHHEHVTLNEAQRSEESLPSLLNPERFFVALLLRMTQSEALLRTVIRETHYLRVHFSSRSW